MKKEKNSFRFQGNSQIRNGGPGNSHPAVLEGEIEAKFEIFYLRCGDQIDILIFVVESFSTALQCVEIR